jgi:hypothetical protein
MSEINFEKNRLKEPDATYLKNLQTQHPDMYKLRLENSHITELHLLFSPGLLPEDTIKLEHLKKITTDYDFKLKNREIEGEVKLDDIKLIADELKPVLHYTQIRGVELWESEFYVMKWFLRQQTIPIILLFDEDLYREWDEEGIFIQNGHIIALKQDFSGLDELENAKPYFSKILLRYLEIRGYQVTSYMLENFIEPSWLSKYALRIEYEFDDIDESDSYDKDEEYKSEYLDEDEDYYN